MRIPLSEPSFLGNERAYLDECVTSTYVSSVGPFVDRFEEEMADRLGAPHAVACSTGTAALHVALVALGVAPGDLVAVSSFTFIASVNAIAYTGADPLLVDSETTSWNMDTARLHDEIVGRARRGDRLPKVIEVVHAFGQPADVEPLLELEERFDMTIVEDAAEALGATLDVGQGPRCVGTFGTVGCLSFNGNKMITTGGGGMVLTGDGDLAARVRHLTTQARVPGPGYVHDAVGYNYRLTNVAAALGVAQLEQLDGFLVARSAVARRYETAFRELPGVQTAPGLPHADPSHWLSVALFESEATREHVRTHLGGLDIEARPLWYPIHEQPPYARAERVGGEVAADIARRGLALPSSATLTPSQQDRVIDGIADAVVSHRAVAGGTPS